MFGWLDEVGWEVAAMEEEAEEGSRRVSMFEGVADGPFFSWLLEELNLDNFE
jgi:hypothetical protein